MRWIRLLRSDDTDTASARALRWITSVAGEARRPLAIASLVTIGLSALALVPPVLLARLVDAALLARDRRYAGFVFAALVATALVEGVLSVARRSVIIRTQATLRGRFAQAQHRRLFRLPLTSFQDGNHGALIRSFDDLDQALQLATEILVELATNALLVTLFAALMLATNWLVGAGVILCVGASLATALWLGRRSRAAFGEWMRVRDSRLGHIVDTVTSMLTLKVNAAHALMQRRFRAEQYAENTAYANMETRAAMAEGSVRAWSLFTTALTASLGGYSVIAGRMTPGQFVLFLATSSMLAGPAFALVSRWDGLQHALVSVDRLHELARQTLETSRPPALASRARLRGDVFFERVAFRHATAGTSETLRDITLRIPAGEHVALVGTSGAGKTTLAYLLAGLYKPNEGVIYYDDLPQAAHGTDGIRANVALVPYATDLFAMSVHENIALGKPDATRAEVEEVARLACLHDVVATFPAGYDTALGSGGRDLSNGQRQRLGIARALLRNTPIIVLDEATAALDAETELHVVEQIRAHCRDRTIVLITHKMDLAARMDRIVTMDGGSVALASGVWDRSAGTAVSVAPSLLAPSLLAKTSNDSE